MRVGHRLRRLTGHRHLRHVLADQEGGGLEQRAFDLAAEAGAVAAFERREDADHAEHAAGDVDHRGARAQRPARRPGHIGEAAHHLRHLVERGAMLVGAGEEALGGAVDQPGIGVLERCVAEPEPVERARAEILDHDVGARRTAARAAASPSVALEIEADAALVAVEHREIASARARAGVRVWSPPSGSTLITSAPRSARITPVDGPMTMCVNSITLMPASGNASSCTFDDPPASTAPRYLL